MKNSFAYSIFKIGILLLIVYSFSGCKKTTQPLTYKFSANALAYIQFTSGKYFIYKDSAANKTDSVVVTESLIQPNSHIGTGVGFDFSYN
ncbi:MAG TPA: hypothetical protein VFE53_26455, partial [Mucilaginibacter sp.]|nr:hypothetical protein [Mucilaginibacter sp.]